VKWQDWVAGKRHLDKRSWVYVYLFCLILIASFAVRAIQ